jgi:hypothetical protein
MNLNSEEKLKFQDMLKEGDCVDNTDMIRKLKHSSLITRDVTTILQIKKKMHTNDFKTLDAECLKHCRFLFDNYTNIYNKLLKGQIDLKIFYQFLHYLKKIEDGELGFYEASYQIGCLLKQLYVDPLVETIENEKEKNREKDGNGNVKVKEISWNEYKNMVHI